MYLHVRLSLLLLDCMKETRAVAPANLFLAFDHPSAVCAYAVEMEPQSVSALPFRVGFRREGAGPAKIIPVGHVLADADDQLARIGVLSIDLPKQCIRRGNRNSLPM